MMYMNFIKKIIFMIKHRHTLISIDVDEDDDYYE